MSLIYMKKNMWGTLIYMKGFKTKLVFKRRQKGYLAVAH